MIELVPITQRGAFSFIDGHHRHHSSPVGALFCIAAVNDGIQLVGVIVVGRPVSRMLDNGFTAEVTRCCTDGSAEAHNAASKLYAAAWRAARAMGYRRMITYTLADETGVSLVAAGWRVLYQTKGGHWSRERRPRLDRHPLGAKSLWEVTAGATRH